MCCHWIRQRVNLAHPRVIISIISGKYCVISNAGYTTEHLICSLSARNVSLLLPTPTPSTCQKSQPRVNNQTWCFLVCSLRRREEGEGRELGQVLMFTTRLGQLCSLEQICSLMMFSASGDQCLCFSHPQLRTE